MRMTKEEQEILEEPAKPPINTESGWNNLAYAICLELCFQLTCEMNDDKFNMYDRELFYKYVCGEEDGSVAVASTASAPVRQLSGSTWKKTNEYNRLLPSFGSKWRPVANAPLFDGADLQYSKQWFVTIKLYKSTAELWKDINSNKKKRSTKTSMTFHEIFPLIKNS